MIALMALPVAGFTQAQLTAADPSKTATKPARPNSESVEAIYVELVTSFNEKEGQVIEVHFGQEAFDKITDKESLVQLKDLSGKQFKSVPDAMAHLASLNFKYLDTYTIPGKDGKNQAHLIFEKRTLGRAAREDMREKQPNVRTAEPAKPADSKTPAPKK